MNVAPPAVDESICSGEEEAVSKCQNTPSERPAAPGRAHSLLLCCFRDLCNHEDSPIARARLNLTAPDEEVSRVGWARAGAGGEAWLRAATVAVPVCGALILLLLVAVAVRLLRADALLHAHHKLRGGYISPLSQHNGDDVKKVWIGNSPLLVAPGGCLVAVERAQLLEQPPPHKER
ncbi:BMP and activin membrane-bound inhibitor homolog [Eumeta japonica]|uniref:BMP and activin membrane-bound inhibitor homolog n=1 Tax=Eumeta variegata TaxID=151549 RepID=A0A4C1XDC9_EUMVA|nr:BMP and activin membrane-bound inhibitor homolog [Eumeta japonica]